MPTIYDSALTKAQNVANIKAALASYIATGTDGAPYVKTDELLDWLNGQIDQTVALNTGNLAYAQYLRSVSAGPQPLVEVLAAAYRPETWKQRSSAWPLTGETIDRESLLSSLDKVQADALKVAHDLIYYAEDKSNKELRTLVERWFDGTILPDYPEATDRITDTRVYAVTWATDWGEESAPSAVTGLITADQNDSVTITMPSVPTGKNITHWSIYRSVTGSDRGALQFLVQLPIGTTSYVDTKVADELGEVCATQTWTPPPAGLTGLVGGPNGVMAGFVGRDVRFCEPYTPYAWPEEYAVPIEFDGVALAVFGQTYAVGTKGKPYLISGADSASMAGLKLEFPQACVSKRSMIGVGGGAVYASPDGLCLIGDGTPRVITEKQYSRDDWQALDPTSMFCAEHEGTVYCWYTGGSGGCLTIDLMTGQVGTIELSATAAWVDPLTDAMFVASGTSISKVFGGASRRTGLWKSKLFRLPQRASFAWAKAVGDITANVTVRIYKAGESTAWFTATISSGKPVRLPAGRYEDWQFEVESTARIVAVVLASDTSSLQEVAV